MKRNTKFYRKNEVEVMKSLGLKPTKNSGSGWIEKEDGQNDYVICQLKSTDAQSIKVNQKDIRMLEHNAAVCNKLPLFAIQFLNTNEVWLMMKPEDVTEIAKYIEDGECKRTENIFGTNPTGIGPDYYNGYATASLSKQKPREVEVIAGGRSAGKKAFMKELENKYKKKGKSAL